MKNKVTKVTDAAKTATHEHELFGSLSMDETVDEYIDRVRGGPARLPTFSGGSPRPGVDLDDSVGLLDVMDDSEPSDINAIVEPKQDRA